MIILLLIDEYYTSNLFPLRKSIAPLQSRRVHMKNVKTSGNILVFQAHYFKQFIFMTINYAQTVTIRVKSNLVRLFEHNFNSVYQHQSHQLGFREKKKSNLQTCMIFLCYTILIEAGYLDPT